MPGRRRPPPDPPKRAIGAALSGLPARRPVLVLGLSTALVFLMALLSPVSYAGSDSHFTLVVTQALLEHRTTRLDPYQDVLASQLETFASQVAPVGGHLYNAYPIGTSLVAVPVVWVSNVLGQDMTIVSHNYRMQNLLSAASCAGVFALLYALGREFVSRVASLSISLIGTLGSSLVSTLATGLWNLNFAVLFTTLSLVLLVRTYRRTAPRGTPCVIGLGMAAAFLCRPTAAVFVGLGLLALAMRDRRAAVKAGASALLPVLAFLGANMWEQGQALPWYFDPSRLAHDPLRDTHAGIALLGLTFSPSRGLFVFGPFLLLLFPGSLLLGRRVVRRRSYWFGAGWLLLLIATASRFGHWWGGHSYGPRLLTEGVVPLLLIGFVCWQALSLQAAGRLAMAGKALFVLLGSAAIVIHSVQGLLNPATVRWNDYPSIDLYPGYLFSWRYPQFAATLRSLHARYLEHVLWEAEQGRLDLDVYRLGEVCAHPADGQSCVLVGWWSASADEWWTETREAHVLLRLGAVDEREDYCLQLNADALRAQRADLLVNGLDIGHVQFTLGRSERRLLVPGAGLNSRELTDIRIRLPDARFPGPNAVRQLGLRYVPHRLGLRDLRLVLSPVDGDSCR